MYLNIAAGTDQFLVLLKSIDQPSSDVFE
jgi:hypothetical protein